VLCLVSGAAGFLGSHLCDRLLREGHEVIGVDNLRTSSGANVAHLSGCSEFTFLEHDVCRSLHVGQDVKAIFHLAGLPTPKSFLNDPISALSVGSLWTRNLLEVARRSKARFLLASTSERYGDIPDGPVPETYTGRISPTGDRACYIESKRFAEALTMAYHRSYGLRTNIAVIFNTYGPRMNPEDGRLIPASISRALRALPLAISGDGLQRRSFCFVTDLVDGLYRLILSEERLPTNLGHPRATTVLELVDLIRALTGASVPVVFSASAADQRWCQPDITKAGTVLGWSPKVDLLEGLPPTISALRAALRSSPTETCEARIPEPVDVQPQEAGSCPPAKAFGRH
jgi:dTDP-glucose 4,6-dehydratase